MRICGSTYILGEPYSLSMVLSNHISTSDMLKFISHISYVVFPFPSYFLLLSFSRWCSMMMLLFLIIVVVFYILLLCILQSFFQFISFTNRGRYFFFVFCFLIFVFLFLLGVLFIFTYSFFTCLTNSSSFL